MSEPVIEREDAPEHGANFWKNLTEQMTSETKQMPVTNEPAVNEPTPIRRQGSRRVWPVAAAAAVLVIVGFGALISRGGSDPSTEVVAGPTVRAEAAALDGPADTDAITEGDAESTGQDTAETSEDNEVASTTDAGTSDGPVTATDGITSETPTLAAPSDDAEPLPEFDAAPGAIGDTRYLPLDQGIPDTATFLGTWDERRVSWYAVTDTAGSCQEASFAEIRFVNPSGITQLVRDPQLRFSGDISHFTVHPRRDLAAWVVSCGQQIELHVANLAPTGEVQDIDMVWFGEGSISSALVSWQGDEVSLNAFDPQGTAFWIDFSVVNRLPSRNDGPSRIMLEAGAPGQRSLVALAANPDASMTYFAGSAPSGTRSACPGDFGSDRATTLWLRSGEGQWQPAPAEDTPLGAVTAMAIEPEFSQVAFADLCDGQVGRLFLGTVRADGRLSALREVDLAPFVPGFVAELFWADPKTLRVETDNSEYGFGTVRFDFRFDDGRDQGILVQLD